jgi:nucleotide-binding universal stress UspA family protein
MRESMFPTKVLLATDGSEDAFTASRMAIELTNKTGSELHVAHVGAALPPIYGYMEAQPADLVDPERAEQEARRLLDEQVERIETEGGSVAEAHLEIGEADEKVVALSEQLGAGLIVVGSRGLGGLRRALMGSVSASIVHHAHCPVLVVRTIKDGTSIFPTKIVLATDGSGEATLAARTAIDLVDKTGSELHVVYAVPIPLAIDAPSEALAMSEVATEEVKERAQRFLDDQVEKIEATGGTVARAHVRLGRTDEETITLADELGAGLIVVGSRGLGGLSRALMGSVSDSVVRHAHCPVLVVRKEERPPRSADDRPVEERPSKPPPSPVLP